MGVRGAGRSCPYMYHVAAEFCRTFSFLTNFYRFPQLFVTELFLFLVFNGRFPVSLPLRDRPIRYPKYPIPQIRTPMAYSKLRMRQSQSYAFPVPLCVRVPLETQTPAHLKGLSRFRVTGACRCVVPSLLPESSEDVLRALHALRAFVERAVYYMEAYCLSSTGVSRHMREISDGAMRCWDWEESNPENRIKNLAESLEGRLSAINHRLDGRG